MAIHWEDLMDGYNDRYGTTYSSLREFMHSMYKRHETYEKVAEILGVSTTTFRLHATKHHGVKSKPPGNPTKTAVVRKRLLKIDKEKAKDLTVSQIAKMFNCSHTSVRSILRKAGIRYKKIRTG